MLRRCMNLDRDIANGGLLFRVCICRGACLYFFCIRLSRLVYVVSCVCLVWGVVLARIVGLGMCLGPG